VLPHSNAYQRFKDQSVEFLDFAVLVCTAVPTLTKRLETERSSASASVDYFRKVNSAEELLAYSSRYQDELSRLSIITLFSFFEAYVVALLGEIIKFHGGKEEFIATADRRSRKFMVAPKGDIVASKRKLQEPAKKHLKPKYEKYSKKLADGGYRFPSELLASLGARILAKRASPRGLKAYEIPEMLRDMLNFPLSAAQLANLESIRQMRNGIAHGASQKVTLHEVMSTEAELRKLAARVDSHSIEHFFVLERFAP
jgi:hypothetical protein